MNEKYIVLEQTVLSDIAAIDHLFQDIGSPAVSDDIGQEALIVLAYRLHNLYSAFENLFRNIAAVFENSLDDASHWRAQLLQRMTLDLMPVRPAVIDRDAYDALDELRRFRHVFRYAYGVDLDPLRLRLVLKPMYRLGIGQFLDFVRGLWVSDYCNSRFRQIGSG